MGVDDHDTFTGLTKLHAAAYAGDVEKVVELMDAGADADIQANGENSGKTAAMLAASIGSTDVLKAMNRGPSLLDLQSADGGTAAMSAAVHSHAGVLDFLIEKKVDLNAVDEDGWTALMFACSVGSVAAVTALVKAGVNASIKNSDGATAMDLCKANKKRHGLIQILDPKEPLPTVSE
eukprot:CAMPEP_0197586322 /NCGR_PEP_ID=MMETSP1326-20131121/8320_1 /TAXON_ID=1155430 /ORGANISM="Genus nov. species nov., Strain RCC2288" /LENGTH=177 /DNA_ID=CAMNT_0043150925 /DNA_START=99 /DNA_END=632 /DNA_ORIENTATION=-